MFLHPKGTAGSGIVTTAAHLRVLPQQRTGTPPRPWDTAGFEIVETEAVPGFLSGPGQCIQFHPMDMVDAGIS